MTEGRGGGGGGLPAAAGETFSSSCTFSELRRESNRESRPGSEYTSCVRGNERRLEDSDVSDCSSTFPIVVNS